MSSTISHKIKQRQNANDVFITPRPLAKLAIDMVDHQEGDVWLDPFRNSGSYFDQFPTDNKNWCEILDGRDFFEWQPLFTQDVICSNPPYSILDKVIARSIELQPRVINYLIGINNLTSRRIEIFNKSGYYLTKLHMCKVYRWYGMSVIVQFEKRDGLDTNLISFDRTVWR